MLFFSPSFEVPSEIKALLVEEMKKRHSPLARHYPDTTHLSVEWSEPWSQKAHFGFLQIRKEKKNSERNMPLYRMVFFVFAFKTSICALKLLLRQYAYGLQLEDRFKCVRCFMTSVTPGLPCAYPISPRRARPWPWWLFWLATTLNLSTIYIIQRAIEVNR